MLNQFSRTQLLLGEEGHVLKEDARALQAVPLGRASADSADQVLELHHAVVHAREVGLGADDLAEQAELEVADRAVGAIDRVLVVLRSDLVVLHEVRDDLVQVGVDALVHLEAEAQLHLKEEVGVEVVHDEARDDAV